MERIVEGINSILWNDQFWLPENITWADFKGSEDMYIPKARDLWVVLPVAATILLLRVVWERMVAAPIGRAYKLRDLPPTRPLPNPVLETAFKRYSKVLPSDFSKVEVLAREVGLTTRQVERWWRRRRVLGKESEMQRFRETTWRFVYYLFIFHYGLWMLWDKPWFTVGTQHCWHDFPRQHVTADLWYYYIIQFGFYLSLVFSMCIDVKRKDFWQMVVHHAASILLLTFSSVTNLVRIGSLVLIIHDANDYWLEGAKLAKYLRYHKLCDFMFIMFACMWFVTRLVIFPGKILKSTLNEAHHFTGMAGCYYLFNGLLLCLQVLNVLWFWLLCRAVYLYVITGRVEKDERSASEMETDGEDVTICENSNDPRLRETYDAGVLSNGVSAHSNNSNGVVSRRKCAQNGVQNGAKKDI